METDMFVTLMVATVAMLMLWWCVVRVRRRLESSARRQEALSREIYSRIGYLTL